MFFAIRYFLHRLTGREIPDTWLFYPPLFLEDEPHRRRRLSRDDIAALRTAKRKAGEPGGRHQ